MITAAILAGGLATRLRPLTTTTPKSLVEVNGEPFIVHQLKLLRANGIDRVVLCVGYLGEMIENEIGDGANFGMQVRYSFDGDVRLGTGGALKKAIPMLGAAFLVLYGDSYLPCDYLAVAERFAQSNKLALMTVFRNDNQWDVSNVEFANGKIINYDKMKRTARMQHIDYGLGAFRDTAFADVPNDKPADLADVYRKLLERGEVAGVEVSERFYEIGSPQGLIETAEYLRVKEIE
jgi:MurNAc alpha-1-phosphate uridylyltransferase